MQILQDLIPTLAYCIALYFQQSIGINLAFVSLPFVVVINPHFLLLLSMIVGLTRKTEFSHFKTHLITRFSWKTSLNALILLQSLNVMMNQIFQSVQNFKNFKIYLYFVSQPDGPTSGKRMVPEIHTTKVIMADLRTKPSFAMEMPLIVRLTFFLLP